MSFPAVIEVHNLSCEVGETEFASVLDRAPNGCTAEFVSTLAINLLGTAKFKFSPSVFFQVMTPATFSSIVSNGPPLLPCDAGAVVCTQLRPLESSLKPLMMPSDTEFSSPSGLPIATT